MYLNMTRTYAECRAALAYVDRARLLGRRRVPREARRRAVRAHGKIKRKHGIDDERAALWERVDA